MSADELPPFLIATRNRHKVAEIAAFLGGNQTHSSDKPVNEPPFPRPPRGLSDPPERASARAEGRGVQGARASNDLCANGFPTPEPKAVGSRATPWLADFRIATLHELEALGDLPEDGATFAANASQKAGEVVRFLHDSGHPWSRSGGFVLADDSGLEVDALGGQPGVHSARFAFLDSGAPGNAPDADNNAKLLRLLENVPDARRTARFRCVLALLRLSDPSDVNFFEGVCEGKIIQSPSGVGGFGYDPLFIPEGHDKTFAGLPPERKNEISHRARALGKLRDYSATIR